MSTARNGVVLLISLYVQAVAHRSALEAGIQVMPFAAGIMIAAPFSGRLLRTLPAHLLCAAGLCISLVGLGFIATQLQPNLSSCAIAGALAVVGVGAGLALTPNTNIPMSRAEQRHRGAANGLRSMFLNTGQAGGTGLALAIITMSLPQADPHASIQATPARSRTTPCT